MPPVPPVPPPLLGNLALSLDAVVEKNPRVKRVAVEVFVVNTNTKEKSEPVTLAKPLDSKGARLVVKDSANGPSIEETDAFSTSLAHPPRKGFFLNVHWDQYVGVCFLGFSSTPTHLCVDIVTLEKEDESIRRRGSATFSFSETKQTFVARHELTLPEQRAAFEATPARVVSDKTLERGVAEFTLSRTSSFSPPPFPPLALPAVGETRAYHEALQKWAGTPDKWRYEYCAQQRTLPRWFGTRAAMWLPGAAMVRQSHVSPLDFRATPEWIIRQFEVAAFVLGVDLPPALEVENPKHQKLFAMALRMHVERTAYAHDTRLVLGTQGAVGCNATVRHQNQRGVDCKSKALFIHDLAVFWRSMNLEGAETAPELFLVSVKRMARIYVPFVVWGTVRTIDDPNIYTRPMAENAEETETQNPHAFALLLSVDTVRAALRVSNSKEPQGVKAEPFLLESVMIEDTNTGDVSISKEFAKVHDAAFNAVVRQGLNGKIAVSHSECFQKFYVGGKAVVPFSMHQFVSSMTSSVPAAEKWVEDGSYVFHWVNRESPPKRGATLKEVIGLAGSSLFLDTAPPIPSGLLQKIDAAISLERPLSVMDTSPAKNAAKLELARQVFGEADADTKPSCDDLVLFVDVVWLCDGKRRPTYGPLNPKKVAVVRAILDQTARKIGSGMPRVVSISSDAGRWICARVAF